MAFGNRVGHRRASPRAGIVLGIGLGGFVDGIVLHQIVRWHHVLSARVPPTTLDAMHVNMYWDGVFHAGAWLVTLLGVFLLRADSPTASPRELTGQLLIGWGVFNLVEGGVNHHLLQLHHVRDLPAHVPLYDWLFLALGGLGLLALGIVLQREPARRRWR